MKIAKPESLTRTESLLSQLCDNLFLRLWSWPTPRKKDGKELCDLIAIFDSHIFLFFDRESRALQNKNKSIAITWPRWKKEAIDKQINTAKGAARYIRDGGPIFLDTQCEQPFPGVIPDSTTIHKIIVAHGAEEACKAQSKDNVYGSLAIAYEDVPDIHPTPFFVQLKRSDPVHILDSVNLQILLIELDTFADFLAYIREKERAIERHNLLMYCGEEDLLAHYFMNHDEQAARYRIGHSDSSINALMIEEGMWKDFADSGMRGRRNEANKQSFLWDELIQRTYQNALEGTTGGASLWKGKDALREMARESRLARRALSGRMLEAIRSFPPIREGIIRKLAYMPSLSDRSKMYVFLQLRCPGKPFDEYREVRQYMLSVACGVVRNRFTHLKTVVGIAMDAPKYSSHDGEDFALLVCEHWSDEERAYYDRENEKLGFFKKAQKSERRITDFG